MPLRGGGRSKNLGGPLPIGCLVVLLFSFLYLKNPGGGGGAWPPGIPPSGTSAPILGKTRWIKTCMESIDVIQGKPQSYPPPFPCWALKAVIVSKLKVRLVLINIIY